MNDPAPIDRDALWQMMGRAMAAALSRAPGLVVRVAPGAWRVTSDVDSWMANWIVCHGPDEASRAVFQAGLDDAVAGGRTTSVAVGEAVRDLIAPLFAGLPMRSEGADPLMWRDARPLPPNPRPYPGQVTRVDPGIDLTATLTAVLDLIARAFEQDPARIRLAMVGILDDPAMRLFTASSETLDSVCLTYAEASVTHIYLMATDPDRQRRGAGWAVLTRAMETAIGDGATQFFLEASGAGEPLYRALGYETYDSAEYWMVNPPPDE
jgi:ribosomal protein S18 acetylase RimI-like enzyme